jgi:DNA-binding transcriptional LysR family regulator
MACSLSLAPLAAASYFEGRPQLLTPHDLTEHACINLRLPTSGGFYVWDFRKDGRELRVRVQGQLVFNAVSLIRNGALEGLGLAHLPEDLVEADIRQGRLVRVRADCRGRLAQAITCTTRATVNPRQHSCS